MFKMKEQKPLQTLITHDVTVSIDISNQAALFISEQSRCLQQKGLNIQSDVSRHNACFGGIFDKEEPDWTLAGSEAFLKVQLSQRLRTERSPEILSPKGQLR